MGCFSTYTQITLYCLISQLYLCEEMEMNVICFQMKYMMLRLVFIHEQQKVKLNFFHYNFLPYFPYFNLEYSFSQLKHLHSSLLFNGFGVWSSDVVCVGLVGAFVWLQWRPDIQIIFLQDKIYCLLNNTILDLSLCIPTSHSFLHRRVG